MCSLRGRSTLWTPCAFLKKSHCLGGRPFIINCVLTRSMLGRSSGFGCIFLVMVYKNKMHAWNKHCFTPIQLTCVVHSDKGIMLHNMPSPPKSSCMCLSSTLRSVKNLSDCNQLCVLPQLPVCNISLASQEFRGGLGTL